MNVSPRIRCFIVAGGLALLAACAKTDPAADVLSARKSLDKGDYKAAVIEAKNALKAAPDNGEARYLLARALMESGDVTGAETEARKAIDLNYSRDEACVLLGRALLRKNDYKRVLSELPRCEVTSPVAKADVGAAMARAHLGVGDIKTARSLADNALAQSADSIDARILVAEITARESGELFLYANDTAIAFSDNAWFRRNNRGTALVSIERLRD